MNTPSPLFKEGDKVRTRAFTDCFGEFHPDEKNLSVISVNLVRGSQYGYHDYWRVLVSDADGRLQREGAEHFFKLEAEC